MREDHTEIHSLYCRLTGRDLPLQMPHHFMWNAWKANGYTESDLRLVVAHIQGLIKAKRRYPESLRLYNLVGNLDRWAEDLAEARALARIPKPDKDKESVLKATGRDHVPDTGKGMVQHGKDTVRTAAQIIQGDQELQKLLRLRDSL